MTGEFYERALELVDDDPDTLDSVHSILMKEGLSETAYAQIFALIFFQAKEDDEKISCSSVEKVWKRGKLTLSDMKLFSALNQCCNIIRCYVLASWENCVFSAWASKREVTKAEKDMEAMESLAHAKNILAAAAPLMPNNDCENRISWTEEESGEENR